MSRATKKQYTVAKLIADLEGMDQDLPVAIFNGRGELERPNLTHYFGTEFEGRTRDVVVLTAESDE